MKKCNFTIILVLFSIISNAQKEGNIWHFGKYAGLDFNSGTPVVLSNGVMNASEGCSSISDSAGNLLFYTDGMNVWNKNHLPMMNGTGLMGNSTSTQSGMIIKKPGSQDIYYIFTVFFDFSYSVVDMTLNGGLGDVTAVKNVVLMSNVSSEKQCATRHVNGSDVWVMSHSANSFFAYQLTASGVNPVPVQSTIGLSENGPGQMKFSQQGDKIAFGKNGGTYVVCLFDFDNITGVVSNNIDIPNGNSQSYGIEFSPDGSKLYATGNPSGVKKIYQYDLNAGSAAAIIASKIQVGSTQLGDVTGLQTGPDKRIYISLNASKYLAVINNPDSMGLGCNYADSAIHLGSGECRLGLPGLISDYFADSTVGLNNVEKSNHISLYPNPVKEYLYILNDNFHKNYTATLYAIDGRKISETLITSSLEKINTTHLSNSIYMVEVNVDGVRTIQKFVKE